MYKGEARIRDYIGLVPTFRVKSFIWGFIGLLNIFNVLLFNFLNDLGNSQTLLQPLNFTFFIITIAFDVWAVFILKDLGKRQKEFVLFSGLVSLFLSIMYTTISYRIIYEILEIESMIYFYVMVTLFIILCMFNLYILWGKLSKGYFIRNNLKRVTGISLFITAAGLGMICQKLYSQFADMRSQLIVIAFIILFFGYCFIFTIHNTYKYYLLKKFDAM